MPSSTLGRRVDAAKRVGRLSSKFAFDVEVHSATDIPPRHGFVGLVVQLSRGPKLSATEEVELRPDQRTMGGEVSWTEAKLSMMATLYASETGKAFSDKRCVRVVAVAANAEPLSSVLAVGSTCTPLIGFLPIPRYRISLIGVKPAAFGTTKKVQVQLSWQ